MNLDLPGLSRRIVISLYLFLFIWQPGSSDYGMALGQATPVKPTIRIRDVAVAQFVNNEATLVVAVENEGMTGEQAVVELMPLDDICEFERLRGCDGATQLIYVPSNPQAVNLHSDSPNAQHKILAAGVTEFEWKISSTQGPRRIKFLASIVGCGIPYPYCKGVELDKEDSVLRRSGTLFFRASKDASKSY